jgi:ATP-dependent Lon protease
MAEATTTQPVPAKSFPDRIPVLPVRSTVVYPMGATALQIAYAPNVEALTTHPDPDQMVAIVWTPEGDAPIAPDSLAKIGVAARVLDRLNLPGGTIQATLQGLWRIHLDDVRFDGGYYSAVPRLAEESPADEADSDRLIELILSLVSGVAAKLERINDEVPRILRINVSDPGRFADLTASLCQLSIQQRDEVLQRLDITDRLDYVLEQLQETWNRMQEIENEHAAATQRSGPGREGPPPNRERVSELRQRIRALQAELGEIDPAERDCLEMLRRIEREKLPPRVAAAARREAERLRSVPPASTDAAEIRTYVDVLLHVPWSKTAEMQPIDLARARELLDEEQIGVEEAKRRLLERLAVAKLRGDFEGPIPCITGPPAVGKRGLAATVARILDLPLAELSLGGRGEAQLLGGRRTRNGAQPGKLIGALRGAGVRNPVYLLTEVDEIGIGNVEGDPIAALDEFLDPDYRAEFVDRYLDVPVDLRDALFVATASDFFRIPRSLRDRFIEIRIAGYTPEEKVAIARRKYFPKLARDHGLDPDVLALPDESLVYLTRGYARDAGLGNLRRSISAIMRFLASERAAGNSQPRELTTELIEEVLGLPRYTSTVAESAPEVGVVTGLAWTASGGELMFIEALRMPGTGRLIITGLLGDVMRESVNAAYSYVRSRSRMLGIADNLFAESDLHIHFPVGATPKDGPSAGAAVTLAIASTLSDRPVRHDVSMTGEVTLRGRILEIGGVKEKTLAAYRAGLRIMILPTGNEKDLRDVPEDVRRHMTFHPVDNMEQVFDLALLQRGPTQEPRRASAARSRSANRPRIVAEGEPSERDDKVEDRG